MNEYELSYTIPRSGSGTVLENIRAASEQNARELLRAKYRGQEVQILGGRQVAFGGGRNERRDGNR